jgi:hypothetical protein
MRQTSSQPATTSPQGQPVAALRLAWHGGGRRLTCQWIAVSNDEPTTPAKPADAA